MAWTTVILPTIAIIVFILFCYIPQATLSMTDQVLQKSARRTNGLPSPYDLKRDEVNKGNQLARYLAMVDLEQQYAKAGRQSEFFEAFANVAPFLGDVKGAMVAFSKVDIPHKTADGPLTDNPLMNYHPVNAVDEILRQADSHNVIMVGEEHMNPQTRSLLVPLLKALQKKGFKYFAAETFNENLNETIRRGYCVHHSGFYTEDPLFSEAVSQAIESGYQLVAYECYEQGSNPPGKSFSQERQNLREMGQAKNLKQIIDKDKDAKILVWAGRAHIAKERVAQWTPMAYCFREITGIDPFCVYLPKEVELFESKQETAEYKFATWNGLISVPTLFANDHGEYFGAWGYADVFLPRQTFNHGRANWLKDTIGRIEVDIPRQCINPKGTQLAEVFFKDKTENAVPIDAVIIQRNEIPPALMLPPGKQFLLKVIDSAGNEMGKAELQS